MLMLTSEAALLASARVEKVEFEASKSESGSQVRELTEKIRREKLWVRGANRFLCSRGLAPGRG